MVVKYDEIKSQNSWSCSKRKFQWRSVKKEEILKKIFLKTSKL